MKHTYLTTVGWKRVLQQCTDYFIDFYASMFVKKDTGKVSLQSSPKFLFINLGHLGDALILSYVFPFVRNRYPDAIIDVLTSSSCVPILRNNPFVRTIRIFDHLRNNRDKSTGWKKIYRHHSTLKKVLKEIRAEHYDVSIEGRVHYPNGNLVAFRGNIKHRIGFGSGGYGGLLTTEIKLLESSAYHLIQAILQELEVVEIYEKLKNIKPYYTMSNVLKTRTDIPSLPYPYILVHLESGGEKRQLMPEFILKILHLVLNNSQFHIALCGTSAETEMLFKRLTATIPSARQRITNLIGKTSIDEFYSCALHATAAITLESFAVHLCAIECPTFAFFKNGSGALYFPLTARRAVIVHNHAASLNASLYPNIKSHYMPLLESNEALQILSLFISDCTQSSGINDRQRSFLVS